jgi:hypothetical protein
MDWLAIFLLIAVVLLIVKCSDQQQEIQRLSQAQSPDSGAISDPRPSTE